MYLLICVSSVIVFLQRQVKMSYIFGQKYIFLFCEKGECLQNKQKKMFPLTNDTDDLFYGTVIHLTHFTKFTIEYLCT